MITDKYLDHFLQKLVNLVLTATKVTTFDKVVNLLPPSTSGGVELEGPQEVGGVLEVGANSGDLMDEVLNADDVVLAQSLLNEVIGGDGGPVASDLDKSPLVDKFPDGLEVRSTPGDVRLTDPEHVDGGLVQLDEHAVVDLPQAEQLQNLADLGAHLVDTPNSAHESQLSVSRHIKVALLLGLALKPDLIPLLIPVLLGVLLSPPC